MKKLLGKPHIFLTATFITGACGLVYQVVWQRYLNILVGSEARSSSIIVAVFLAGLACGYYFWGIITKKVLKRRQELKVYGYIEFAIGAWGILFSKFFYLAQGLSYSLPNSLFFDVAVSAILIFPPTFLMGATIPLLTATLPSKSDEINTCHARIYGINTVGAFLGVLAGAFVLVIEFGLGLTSVITGFFNIAVGILFMTNRMDGDVKKTEEIPRIKSNYSQMSVYLLALVSGTVSISLEMLWIRIWGLTIGSSYVVFPMVLSLFVLGLGYGSLTLKDPSVKVLHGQLTKVLVFLALAFFWVSYLPSWTSHLRVMLSTLPVNFTVFYFLCYLILALVLLPFLIPMGRLLPLSYALLKKDKKIYGYQCGLLYFTNTMGTFFGALVLSYALLSFFDFDAIYKIDIFLIFAIAAYFFLKDKRFVAFSAAAAVFFAFIFGTGWERGSHYLGVFKRREPVKNYHFVSFFNAPTIEKSVGLKKIFFKDDVNTTVSVLENLQNKDDLSICVNAKSDSNTIEDFSTMNLSAILPYLFCDNDRDLDVSVIGLGTGITAGLMGTFNDVSSVSVIEISPYVVKAAPLFSAHNYGVAGNPRVETVEMDAFRFFNKSRKKYDIITSEPSNPWVVGVENLYTSHFYRLANRSLKDGGVFLQWVHTYSMDKKILVSICNNILENFAYAGLYLIHPDGDTAIIAGDKPLSGVNLGKRFKEKNLSGSLARMGIPSIEALRFLRLLDTQGLKYLSATEEHYLHSLEFPSIGFKALKAFFLGSSVDVTEILDPFVARFAPKSDDIDRKVLADTLLKWWMKNGNYCRGFETRLSPFCFMFSEFINAYGAYAKGNDQDSIKGYSFLRQAGLVPKNNGFLDLIANKILLKTKGKFSKELYEDLLDEYLKEGEWERAVTFLKNMLYRGNIDKTAYETLIKKTRSTEKEIKTLTDNLPN